MTLQEIEALVSETLQRAALARTTIAEIRCGIASGDEHIKCSRDLIESAEIVLSEIVSAGRRAN